MKSAGRFYVPLGAVLLTLLVLQTHYSAISGSLQEPTSITFAAIGDYGSNDANEQDVALLVKSWNPDYDS